MATIRALLETRIQLDGTMVLVWNRRGTSRYSNYTRKLDPIHARSVKYRHQIGTDSHVTECESTFSNRRGTSNVFYMEGWNRCGCGCRCLKLSPTNTSFKPPWDLRNWNFETYCCTTQRLYHPHELPWSTVIYSLIATPFSKDRFDRMSPLVERYQTFAWLEAAMWGPRTTWNSIIRCPRYSRNRRRRHHPKGLLSHF